MKKTATARSRPEDLCHRCGLCCNGVIFADVRLPVREQARVWAALRPPDAKPPRGKGPMPAPRKPLPGRLLPQPCPAFDGRWCCIYADRPGHCQAFECALLKQVKSGRETVESALRLIRRTRRRVAEVQKLLQLLGDVDETSPLALRFRRVLERLEAEVPNQEEAGHLGRLSCLMQELNLALSVHFYP